MRGPQRDQAVGQFEVEKVCTHRTPVGLEHSNHERADQNQQHARNPPNAEFPLNEIEKTKAVEQKRGRQLACDRERHQRGNTNFGREHQIDQHVDGS